MVGSVHEAEAAALLLAGCGWLMRRMRPPSKPPISPRIEFAPLCGYAPRKRSSQGRQNTRKKDYARRKVQRCAPTTESVLHWSALMESLCASSSDSRGKRAVHAEGGVSIWTRRYWRIALSSAGSRSNPGDKAEIRSLEFKEREIIVALTARAAEERGLRDRITGIGAIPLPDHNQANSQ